MTSLREQLKRDEGERLRAYKDTTGHWTIGYGRNLVAKGITRAMAEAMLDEDIHDVEQDVANLLPWVFSLDLPRQAVLLNMAYNLGAGGLLEFRRMLAAAERGDFIQASAEMLNSSWARQVGDRAERLSKQMATGAWV